MMVLQASTLVISRVAINVTKVLLLRVFILGRWSAYAAQ